MQSFVDNRGHRWLIRIDLPMVLRLRDELSVDLMKQDLSELADDQLRIADVIALLCRNQLPAAGVNADQFSLRFNAVVLEDAGRAFVSALVWFYPEPKKSNTSKPANEKPVDLWRFVDELGGIVGLDPFGMPGLTLRRLLIMAEARERSEWNRTAELLSLIYNVNRQKKEAIPAWKWNPYGEKPPESARIEVSAKQFLGALWAVSPNVRHRGGVANA